MLNDPISQKIQAPKRLSEVLQVTHLQNDPKIPKNPLKFKKNNGETW